MNNIKEYEESKRIIFLPTYYFCNAINDTNLGVLIGIITGFITELLASGEFKCYGWISILSCIISVYFILVTIDQNKKFNSICQNIKINDNDNQFDTLDKLLTKVKEDDTFKKFRIKFISSFIAAILFFVSGLYIEFLSK